MKDKNKKLIIVVSCLILIVVVSISFSYFTSKTTTSGEGQQTIVELATPNNTTLSVEGTIEFNDLDILPGHKNISGLKVTATGEEEVKFNIIWTGTNTINTPIKYYVYKSLTKENPSITCTKKEENSGGAKILYEECTNNNFENIGSVISSGEITNNEEEIKYILKDQEVIEANPDGNTVYYYIVLEYPNLDKDQYPVDKDGHFKGKINAEVLSSSAINPVINNTTTSATSNSITVGVEATDNFGIGNYYYSIDDGEYVKLSEGTYTFTNLNEYTNYKIKVYVDDIYGNQSEIKELTVRTEDASNPELTITTSNETPGDNDWYKSITLVATGEDTGSGVSNIKYCTTTSSTCTPTTVVDGATASVALTSNASEQKVCFQVTDNSGKTSEITCSGTYKVDNTVPTASISSTSSTKNTITVNVSGSDSHSGVQSYRYSINNGAYVQTTSNSHTFTGLSEGTTYTIKVQTVDKVGNLSSEIITSVATESKPANETILANYPTQLTRSDFTTTVTNTTTGTIYYADTSKGRTYYFAGNPTDNWVRFAGFYWRIIRINEDGSIRLIYQGTSENATGTNAQTGTSAFNSTYSNNMYVGFMYTNNQVHGTGSNSTIKGVLDDWYSKNLASYASKLDGNAGFCGDRTPSTSSSSINNSGGTGTTTTYYGGYIRLYGQSNGVPTFECANSSDLYTTSGSNGGNKALTNPIGLISMDEAWYAGGYSANNTSYYLYTGQNYWTMSPFYFLNGWATMFRVDYYGTLNNDGVDGTRGVRPVINLKANVTISGGNGTASSPFEI